MFWLVLSLLVFLGSSTAINLCRYPSLANPLLPTIADDIPPPQGACFNSSICEPSSCSFSFKENGNSCYWNCKCQDPCSIERCYGNQVCVVVKQDGRFFGMCETKPDTKMCSKKYCSETPCVHGYKLDEFNCQTCECKDPCWNFGCRKNSTCQLLKLTPGSEELTPKCVSCPKLVNCPKKGMCKKGLKKDSKGCDVCECAECECDGSKLTGSNPQSDFLCNGVRCADYFKLNTTSGCDSCVCEPIPCHDKCNGDEVCRKLYTPDGHLYGVCEKVNNECPKSECGATRCDHGLRVDQRGCIMTDCSCKDPCQHHQCPTNSYCKTRVCPVNTECYPAYCENCPSLQSCNNECAHGRMLDSNGCATCQCKNSSCEAACPGMYCQFGMMKDPKTGCNMCLCVSSPCDPSPCGESEACSVEMEDKKYVAKCLAPRPPIQCPTVNCDHVNCQYGVERDLNGCFNSRCTCKDFCKGVECGEGKRCLVTKTCDGDCRDVDMTACVPISELPSTTTAATTISRVTRKKEFEDDCPTVSHCYTWCSMKIDPVTSCPFCHCPPNPDYCLNYECPPGKVCRMTGDECAGKENCRDGPMRECVDATSTSATTTKPLCGELTCTSPCQLIPASANNFCPFCKCFDNCQETVCNKEEECLMVVQENCGSACPKVPKCFKARPSSCFLEKNEGVKCREIPILQWYYNQSKNSCQSFFFKGCQGNSNMFPSFESCLSSCYTSYKECSAVSCPEECQFGYKLDGTGCKTCQCVEPCEETRCPSSRMKCKTHLLCSEPDANCTKTFAPVCKCQKVTCQITCPYGKVKDDAGCETCECRDPCQNSMCNENQFCVVAEHLNCVEGVCNSDVKIECIDSVVRRSLLVRVNASYEIYISMKLKAYNKAIKKSLAHHYNVSEKSVYIVKHEKGSILTTAKILLPQDSEVAALTMDFIPIEIEDKKYTANIQIEEKTDPKETETQEKETDVVLIVLLCVFVPIAFVFLIIFLVCLLMHFRNKSGKSEINHRPLSFQSSGRSDELPPLPAFTTEASKDLIMMEKDGSDEAIRYKSFTEA